MKAISTGNIYEIFDDTLMTYDKLPAQSYVVRFDKRRGYFLEKYVDIEINEEKVYGIHAEKVEKVLSSFDKFDRSMGVILSGDKGIGKSLFAKMLSAEGMSRGLPLIVVDKYTPDIASYLETIEQEVIVLFDEFDKTFGEVKSVDGEASPQTALLGLFDGISGGKKLFVVTCNELRKLNEYLINRPGRFHYHLRFDYPSADQIREYMMDKIPEDRYDEIEDVVSFSTRVNLNYDCLRAIAFEISRGETFKSAIRDLNIINLEEEEYNITLHFNNGFKATAKSVRIDMFGDGEYDFWVYDNRYNDAGKVFFNVRDSEFDCRMSANVIAAGDFSFTYDEDENDPAEIVQARASGVNCLTISRKKARALHYMV